MGDERRERALRVVQGGVLRGVGVDDGDALEDQGGQEQDQEGAHCQCCL
jgi:hypothetical protein